jgi:hypothetical protein
MMPEMSRLVAVDRIAPGGLTEHIVATDGERKALATRFDVVAIGELTGLLRLEPWRRGGVKITGRVDAIIVQTCVVTLDPFEVAVRDEISRYFAGRNAPGPAAAVLSVESLEEDAQEVVTGASIDIGEVLAEALGLAIDPYPRKPGAKFESGDDSGQESGSDAGPFAALVKIKATSRTRNGRA